MHLTQSSITNHLFEPAQKLPTCVPYDHGDSPYTHWCNSGSTGRGRSPRRSLHMYNWMISVIKYLSFRSYLFYTKFAKNLKYFCYKISLPNDRLIFQILTESETWWKIVFEKSKNILGNNCIWKCEKIYFLFLSLKCGSRRPVFIHSN